MGDRILRSEAPAIMYVVFPADGGPEVYEDEDRAWERGDEVDGRVVTYGKAG